MPHLFSSQLFDNSGNPLAGGKVYTYEGGTTTNLASYPTYDDAVAGTNAHDNPIVLDANGRTQIWLTDQAYKLRIDTSADVTLDTIDDIYGSGSGATIIIGSDDTTEILLTDNKANAYLFKESTNNYLNFDTQDGSESIDFGNATQNTTFDFLGTGNFNLNSNNLVLNPDNNNGGMLIYQSDTPGRLALSHGTVVTDLDTSDVLGIISFRGAAAGLTSSAGQESAYIKAVVDDDWATNDFPSRIEFGTTADAGSSTTLAMTVESTGIVTHELGSFVPTDIKVTMGDTAASPAGHLMLETDTGVLLQANSSYHLNLKTLSGDIILEPTNGNVKFGTHSAIAAETVTGYITIVDSGGTTRKIAVVS